jgi:hypothetical protein
MIILGLLPVAGVVGAATWWAYSRQLRKLPASSFRCFAAPIGVTITAVLPEDAAIMIVFRCAHRGADQRSRLLESSPAHTLVVERADDGQIVEQLERWCMTAAPLVLRQDRIAHQATFRDVASRISIVLALMSDFTGGQPAIPGTELDGPL